MPPTLLDVPAETTPAPILKWVGGKKRLLSHILPHYTGQASVVEPFFGGGAVSFAIAAQNPHVTVCANDKITELVEIYDAVRTDVEAFICDVNTYAAPYLVLDGKDARRKFYYTIREQYMNRTLDGPAPLFFMLWCAYSGLYRTGKKVPGRFNTSHGFGLEKTDFYHPQRLRASANAMNTWSFTSGDFTDTLDNVSGDSFVFIDPPYRQTYTNYTDGGFSSEDQERVVQYARAAAERGAAVVYTNKDTGDSFYEDSFPGFTINRVPIKYQVNRNCKTTGRPESFEAIVSTGGG